MEQQCTACHAPLPAGSAFCTRCGAAAVRALEVQPARDAQWGVPEPSRRQRRVRERADVPAAAGPDPSAGLLEIRPDVGVLTDERWREVRAAPPAHPAHTALGPAFDGVTPATAGRRLAAFALDTLAVTAVGAGAWAVTSSWLVGVLLALELSAGLVVWEARSGRTIGGSVLGLRAAQDEQPWAPGLGRAVVRATLLGAAHLVLGVGQWVVVASSAWDRTGRRQGWHDRLAGTLVVDVRGLRRSSSASPAPATPAPATSASATPVPATPVPATPRGPQAPEPTAPTSGAGQPTAGVEHVGPAASVSVPSAGPVPEAVGPVTAPIAVPGAPPSYLLTLDDGREVTILGPGLVGRRPQPRDGERCDHLVTVEDPGRSLSRTHARIGLDGDVLWVEDLASANGTAVAAADGTWVQVLSGERVVVPDGGALRLGDRTMKVSRRS